MDINHVVMYELYSSGSVKDKFQTLVNKVITIPFN